MTNPFCDFQQQLCLAVFSRFFRAASFKVPTTGVTGLINAPSFPPSPLDPSQSSAYTRVLGHIYVYTYVCTYMYDCMRRRVHVLVPNEHVVIIKIKLARNSDARIENKCRSFLKGIGRIHDDGSTRKKKRMWPAKINSKCTGIHCSLKDLLFASSGK